jgi:hypothetical protein
LNFTVGETESLVPRHAACADMVSKVAGKLRPLITTYLSYVGLGVGRVR